MTSNSATATSLIKNNAAFTLVEIIIVISLMAFVYVFALPDFGSVSQSEVATVLGRLNADIRSAYDLSVLSGKPYRLVFDLRSGDYWLEETTSLNVKIGDEKIDSDPSKRDLEDQRAMFDSRFEEYEDLAAEPIIDPETDEEIILQSPVILAKEKLRGPEWRRFTSLEWKSRSIGDGLILKDMQAEHHNQKVTIDIDSEEVHGIIYFFPTGYVEKAVLHIFYSKDGVPDENREPYTIMTKSWEGVAVIDSGYIEVEFNEDDSR